MTNEHVLLIDTADRVRTLTLNRPQARNALSSALRTQFFAALREAESADDVDVVIFTGTDPVFCAGLDLKELGDSTELPDISPKWPAMTKPVIGAINGAAVTGGLELALYCDILIASENARFADTHARVGLLPTWGLSVRLPQKVGVGMARRMSMTGDYLSATDALRARMLHWMSWVAYRICSPVGVPFHFREKLAPGLIQSFHPLAVVVTATVAAK